ncbi:hemolysin family protein [bacterium]|nr:hemolysin family protein [bacterium]
MEIPLWVELLAIFLLILANGVFSLAEFSIIASRKARLRQKASDGKPGASRALRLREKPERFLATIQVGITLVGAMVGVFSGATIVDEIANGISYIPVPMIADTAGPIAVVVAVVAITVLSVVIGELVPKYLALSFPERYARIISRPISLFIAVTSVFSRMLSGMAVLIVRMLGVRQSTDENIVTEEEINQMIIEGKERGFFDETERDFVRSVFDFADSTVSRAMTPRTDVVGFEAASGFDDIMAVIREQGYSRYPVFDKSIDEVVGVIYSKDLLKINTADGDFSLDKLLRPPFFVPNSMPLPKLLREFQKGKNHLAIVLDEYGGTDGIITLEDILEELVGEIQDEYDAEAAPLVKHSDTVAYANGTVWPGEINELLDVRLPEEHVDTLAGLFIDTVGHVPEKHETVRIANTRLTVLAKQENRILRLKVEKLPPQEEIGA